MQDISVHNPCSPPQSDLSLIPAMLAARAAETASVCSYGFATGSLRLSHTASAQLQPNLPPHFRKDRSTGHRFS